MEGTQADHGTQIAGMYIEKASGIRVNALSRSCTSSCTYEGGPQRTTS